MGAAIFEKNTPNYLYLENNAPVFLWKFVDECKGLFLLDEFSF